MIYLIGQLSAWLLLTAAFAALAGWALAAQRAAPGDRALRRDRDNLMRDLIRLASGESSAANDEVEIERESDSMRRLATIRDARIAELERALEQARSKSDDAASEIAELQRRLERGAANEITPLVTEVPAAAPEPAPVIDENAALQTWRLRYFEQRVRYLETRAPVAAAAPPVAEQGPNLEWRARDAEARAAHLENELRTLAAASAPVEGPEAPASPFASSANVDTLLRWRLLYLERRVAHLQQAGQEAAQPLPLIATPNDAAPDPDRWKWRARYLEARVRHLEERPAAAPAIAAPAPAMREPDAVEEALPAPAPLVARGAEVKPPVLPSARNGAPDDLTLIDGLTQLQQTTFYSLGVFHFDQIAAWTPANIAWVDQYLRLRGRIVEDEWVEQADDLAREGPDAARRHTEDEAV